MSVRSLLRRKRRVCASLASAAALSALLVGSVSHARADGKIKLFGHLPPALNGARWLQHVDAAQRFDLAISLPLRNQPELAALIRDLHDPNSPLYGQFLTPEQFTARFAPTEADYNAAVEFAKKSGFTVTGLHPNRVLLDVAGTGETVEKAFSVRLNHYRSQEGFVFHAPESEPSLPAALAGKISGIIGMDNAALWQKHSVGRQLTAFDFAVPFAGTGPGGALSPSDIKTAYNLTSTGYNGAGQTLGLFELDGYVASDITFYDNYFGLTHVPLQNVLVDSFNGSAGSGKDEVTLDIELMIALAPGATKILVYEGPNSNAGVVDTYNKIATDNLAKEISSSWGLAELQSAAATRNSENTAYQQYAAQGQSFYVASGDSGAYADGSTISVGDPASQPYAVGVGGTKLTTNGAGGSYSSETTWNGGSAANGGGGGGISAVWSIPSYQSQAGVITAASKASTTKRNVPDVSLDADPNTGYAIYVSGAWNIYGGTSCAAPLWAAFTAQVNQKRVAGGLGLLGFPNPAIYTVGIGSGYTSAFHDIADGSTNLKYAATTGFDDATGWGTFNGVNLLNALSGGGGGPTIPAAPTGLSASPGNAQVALSWTGSSGATSYSVYRSTASGSETGYVTGISGTSYTDTGVTNGTKYYYEVTASNSAGESGKSNEASATPASGGGTPSQLLGNPGFENGSSSPAPWTVTSGVIDSSTGEAAHSGSWKAWLDGYGSSHTDSIVQTVTIPSTVTTATLSFYLHIDTAETTTSTAYDTLKVQIRNSSGTVLTTLATYSNLNKATGFTQKSFNVAAYKGQTIQVYLVGTEDTSLQTSFVVDDFALNVQ